MPVEYSAILHSSLPWATVLVMWRRRSTVLLKVAKNHNVMHVMPCHYVFHTSKCSVCYGPWHCDYSCILYIQYSTASDTVRYSTVEYATVWYIQYFEYFTDLVLVQLIDSGNHSPTRSLIALFSGNCSNRQLKSSMVATVARCWITVILHSVQVYGIHLCSAIYQQLTYSVL